jgi:SAM-dependent methyltransferase
VNDLSTPVAPAPNYAAIKQRQQATWASGDYAVVGTTLQIVGESLAEAVDVRADERVLDVAAGNGNATLAAARRFASVTSTDYVPSLLDKGRERARSEGFVVRFQEADVEELPFPDSSFDVVLSTFGAMFAPDHERAADEIMRVLRSGGRIGIANWKPEGFIGRLFKLIGRHIATTGRRQSPALSGGSRTRRTLVRSRRRSCRAPPFNFATARRRTLSRSSATATTDAQRRLPRPTRPGSRSLGSKSSARWAS